MSAEGNRRRKANHRVHVASVERDSIGRPKDRKYRLTPPRKLREAQRPEDADEKLSPFGYRVPGKVGA